MRASDLAPVHPTITMATASSEAARIPAGSDLPGLNVVDDAGAPLLVLPRTRVPRMAHTHSPPVAVTGPGGTPAGFVTLHGLLDRVLGENA